MFGDRLIFFARPLPRSNRCASHRQRRWLTNLSYRAVAYAVKGATDTQLDARQATRKWSALLALEVGFSSDDDPGMIEQLTGYGTP